MGRDQQFPTSSSRGDSQNSYGYNDYPGYYYDYDYYSYDYNYYDLECHVSSFYLLAFQKLALEAIHVSILIFCFGSSPLVPHPPPVRYALPVTEHARENT